MRPGANGTFTFDAGGLRGLLDRRAAAENDQVGERNLLAAFSRAVELLLDRLKLVEHLCQCGRLVHIPVLLRREANARAVGAAALVGAAEGRGRCPGGRNQLRHREAAMARIFCLSAATSCRRSACDHGRDRVLPDQRFLRHQRAEITRARAHVAVREFEPGAGKRVGELIGMLVESAARSSRKPDPCAATGRSSAWSAHASSMRRARRARRLRHSSPSTASRRPGSWSVPIRF